TPSTSKSSRKANPGAQGSATVMVTGSGRVSTVCVEPSGPDPAPGTDEVERSRSSGADIQRSSRSLAGAELPLCTTPARAGQTVAARAPAPIMSGNQAPGATVNVNDVPIEDTFAEAFPMTGARLVVTAATAGWARTAGQAATGSASSVIGCDAEAGIERALSPDETPDGRPGVSLLLFAFSRDGLQKALVNRVGQCVLTCPTTACYNGLPLVKERAVRVGGNLRFFGDGWQISKLLDGRRYWRLPVMDGEFGCEDLFSTVKGVAGGNFLILGRDQEAALAAAEAAVEAVRSVPGVIAPFPGGVVRSGSKVGSRYKKL